MSDLKPCPFCGNGRNIALTNEKHDHSGGYFIACPECDASTGLRYAMGDDPRPLLIEAWNRRAQPAPITSETGNASPQGASAITSETVPLLTYEEIAAEISERGSMVNGVKGDGFMQGARWAERALRTKLGAVVPMTEEQVMEIANSHVTYGWLDDYIEAIESVVRAAERHHGIVGKEGA